MMNAIAAKRRRVVSGTTYQIAGRVNAAAATRGNAVRQAGGAFQVFAIYDFGNWAIGRAATNNAITCWPPYAGGGGNLSWGTEYRNDVDQWLGFFNSSTFNPLPTYIHWALMLTDTTGDFTSVANGTHDSDIQYLVTQTKAVTGLPRMGVRPGWEFNLVAGWPWNAFTSGNQAGFVAAFRHVHDVLKAQGTASGMQVDVCWCPGAGNNDPRVNTYPGDAYVDWLMMDFGAGGNSADITGNGGWSFASMADASINGFLDGQGVLQGKGKPISVGEAEIQVVNPDNYPTYCTGMQNVLNSTGAKLAYYNIYDSDFSSQGGTNNLPWGNTTATNALNAFITTASNFKAT